MLWGACLWNSVNIDAFVCLAMETDSLRFKLVRPFAGALYLSFEVMPAMQPVIYLVAADVFGLAFVSCSITWLLAVPAVVVAQVGCPAIVFGNALCLCDTPEGRVDNE